MKRITTVLNESEAMTVRKAICAISGTERVALTPIPYRLCGADMVDFYSEKIIAASGKQVRLDVTANDSMAGSIVAVIRRIARAGRIVIASRHERLVKRVA